MFVEDLSPMFDEERGFGVAAEWEGSSFSVIFDYGYFAAPGEEVDFDNSRPRATCWAENVAGIHEGDAITVAGTDYEVVGNPRPDGTGLVILALEEV